MSSVFSEDYEFEYEAARTKVLDPHGPAIHRWNKIFLVACLVSMFVDPLFFYLPGVAKEDLCITISIPLEVVLTVIRSLVDVFYMIQIYVRRQTAYVAPSSRVFGRGELVIDPAKIASRYYLREFWLDLLAAIPLPQVLLWASNPVLTDSPKNFIRFIVIFQYLLRLYTIFPLSSQIINTSGFLTETAWAGAAYNLMLFMLASHVLGSCWYLLSVEQQRECWEAVCRLDSATCRYELLDCRRVEYSAVRGSWLSSSNISTRCDGDPNNLFFRFGIYADAVTSGVTTADFCAKYFYCLWWGLRNLSSLGQNLQTGMHVGEIAVAIVIVILGLVLFALLIGNMQRYLQSTTVRLEEWRIWRTDTENWMRHRQLPHELKQCVRKYDQYRWVTTRGVDEEAILRDLPLDLRREIKRHLSVDLVRRVPLFDQMDERMLDAICERLKPALCTQGTCLVREGDLVTEMLFIIRGHLDSYTTGGGRTGFFNSSCIGPGDFCGEELLTWALDPRPSVILPSSTRTVEAITEVEAFALIAEDLKFVASQFRRLHSKQLRHTFRFYSHQWRTWAACFIQAAWFRFKRRQRRHAAEDTRGEAFFLGMSPDQSPEMDQTGGGSRVSFSMPLAMAPRFRMYSTKSSSSARWDGSDFDILSSLRKPVEPDFTEEEDDE